MLYVILQHDQGKSRHPYFLVSPSTTGRVENHPALLSVGYPLTLHSPPLTPILPAHASRRVKHSHVDVRTSGPAALGSARFKGLSEEVAAVKRRLRDKCRRRWVSSRGSSNGGGGWAGKSGSGGRSTGWTGSSAEERAEYAKVAEDVLRPFVGGDDRGGEVAYARRWVGFLCRRKGRVWGMGFVVSFVGRGRDLCRSGCPRCRCW